MSATPSATDPSPARSELCFAVDDMTCGHCSATISKGVAQVDGVDDVRVDLDARRVTVRGRELAEQVVADAILLAGYSPRLI